MGILLELGLLVRRGRAVAILAALGLVMALGVASGHAGGAGAVSVPADRPGLAGGGQPTLRQRWKRARLVDTELFGTDTTVVEMIVPAEWQVQAGTQVDVRQLGGCPENAIRGRFEASSPDSRVGLSLWPPYTTMHFRNPALKMDADRRRQMGVTFCAEAPRMTLAEVVEHHWIPEYRPGARVVAYETLPTLTGAVSAQARQLAEAMGPASTSAAEAGMVTIVFTSAGQAVEERVYLQGIWIAQDVACTPQQRAQDEAYRQMHLQMGQPPPPSVCGDGQGSLIFSTYTPLLVVRAPQGRSREVAAVHRDIVASMRVNTRAILAMSAVVDQLRRAVFNSMSGQIRVESDIWRRSWAEISAQQVSDAERRRDSRLDIAGMWSDTVLGSEEYRDRNGDAVRLSSGYEHVYSNGQGEYILTNDAIGHPATDLGRDWQAITPIGRRGQQ